MALFLHIQIHMKVHLKVHKVCEPICPTLDLDGVCHYADSVLSLERTMPHQENKKEPHYSCINRKVKGEAV